MPLSSCRWLLYVYKAGHKPQDNENIYEIITVYNILIYESDYQLSVLKAIMYTTMFNWNVKTHNLLNWVLKHKINVLSCKHLYLFSYH